MSSGRLVAATDRALREVGQAYRALGPGGRALHATRGELGLPERRPLERWLEATAGAHARYRELVEPAPGEVAIVCVTSRPAFVHNVAANLARQTRAAAALVVTHGTELEPDDVRRACAPIATPVEVIDGSAVPTLGDCLNLAIGRLDTRYVAKFDDDDHYGAAYLDDALRAHRIGGAGVVGKHSWFGYLPRRGELVLRFPGNEFRYTGTLAGGTLVIDRNLTGTARFPSLNYGEDRGFLRACHRRLVRTMSADRFNYVQIRAGHNTWPIPDDEFARTAIVVGAELDPAITDR